MHFRAITEGGVPRLRKQRHQVPPTVTEPRKAAVSDVCGAQQAQGKGEKLHQVHDGGGRHALGGDAGQQVQRSVGGLGQAGHRRRRDHVHRAGTASYARRQL